MPENKLLNYTKSVIENIPQDWLNLTTHRLDIYNESLAKTEFLEQFELLYEANNADASALNNLPTAFDYIRLGHPLSCVLEWVIAKLQDVKPENVICFSSMTMPVLAVLRKNLLAGKKTQILYKSELPKYFDAEILREIYGYTFDLMPLDQVDETAAFEGSTILISDRDNICQFDLSLNADFSVNTHPDLGSILLIHDEESADYVSEIQHVRRRESIAMTPADTLTALQQLVYEFAPESTEIDVEGNKKHVSDSIKQITGTNVDPAIASSGLSMQYAIVMGLIHDAREKHPGKAIKIIVPPNCYGGTNDQARRVAACIDNVEVVDLPVDGDNDMVQSTNLVLEQVAKADAVPLIIAEIPTNPRVEVPDLVKLKDALSEVRKTLEGKTAVDPVFILDQTFCPNVHFLGEGNVLAPVRTIAYVSGSKFPSGGKCTAGYCVANKKAETLLSQIKTHLLLCDNAATDLQMEILAKQLPSMNQRIHDAYLNTREFVNFIRSTLPEAKINFVSEELAEKGFTPSVFSLDLPTKGNTEAEREAYKRALNLKLINLMINEIPAESKFCVSYGQLKGCYWTIPATSTQGTTKEGDKDYIVRVALSPDMDLGLHKKVFSSFVEDFIGVDYE
ncbi:MAG: cystathionine beta-synthase [Bacteroidetes bacterium]|nr:cystathionine beta-synthase [Bacteroidota bacterium]